MLASAAYTSSVGRRWLSSGMVERNVFVGSFCSIKPYPLHSVELRKSEWRRHLGASD
jgi:hypothetical protein